MYGANAKINNTKYNNKNVKYLLTQCHKRYIIIIENKNGIRIRDILRDMLET